MHSGKLHITVQYPLNTFTRINYLFSKQIKQLLSRPDANAIVEWSATALDSSNIPVLKCVAASLKNPQYHRS
ncbi:hypothetical protein EHW66_05110 [Erwinia psidii]|uniref:hypothetical protein n=1 Tax=Erwinia psidii TaxID=69224 RepID=UPI00226B4233|nr:hypothetical protein [Erwinia psidii]MCX8964411.1 hypothetical protein [Erwinia psidii]